MNRITVKINGVEYTVKGEEKDEYINKIAGYVDKKLRNIMEMNPRLDTAAASVLTAVNTVDEVFKLRQAVEDMHKEKEEFKKLEVSLNDEIKVLKRQLINMDEFSNELKNKLKNSKNEEEIKHKDEILVQKDEMINKLKESLQRHIKEVDQLKTNNKELKFQNQSGKYKILDLQQKLMDTQIDMARTKKQSQEVKIPPKA